jgi:cytoskeletal protein CcmA (bactofilin family)
MFGEKKDRQAEKDLTATLPKAATLPDAAPIAGRDVQQSPAVQPEAASTQPEATSSISSSMTIVGKLFCDGLLKVFGRVEGELLASSVLICEGARVEGKVVAKELTIGGHVRGTIRAVRVKLQSSAVVEGEIFYRSLAIEESALFEGTAQREDNLTDTLSSVQENRSDAQSLAEKAAENATEAFFVKPVSNAEAEKSLAGESPWPNAVARGEKGKPTGPSPAFAKARKTKAQADSKLIRIEVTDADESPDCGATSIPPT